VRRHLLALLAAVVVVAGGAGVAVAESPPQLTATGPSTVAGTTATAVFDVGDRTIRQVRYHDKGTLYYTFELRNDGSFPVEVTGLAPLERAPKLFRYLALRDEAGSERFRVGAGERVEVELTMRMEACETLSARAGSFATEMNLTTTRAGFVHDVVRVLLPEQLHTGSPREAFCPDSTASSRPPG
jgi:hypothetical protein